MKKLNEEQQIFYDSFIGQPYKNITGIYYPMRLLEANGVPFCSTRDHQKMRMGIRLKNCPVKSDGSIDINLGIVYDVHWG